MDIVKAFKDAFDIYIKNFIIIILGTLVAIALGMLTFGILYAPLLVGVQMLFVKAKRGQPLRFTEIFSPIKRFFSLFFGCIWIAILITIGFILLVVPGLIWMSWWIFALLFIYDKGMGIGQGMAASKQIVRKNNLWLHLILIILTCVVAQLGYYVFVIGYLFTLPLALGAIACAYVDES
jgi:hypothetical protein